MKLREKFIKFCELTKSAEEIKARRGYNDSQTLKAFEELNKLKREILEEIDENSNHK